MHGLEVGGLNTFAGRIVHSIILQKALFRRRSIEAMVTGNGFKLPIGVGYLLLQNPVDVLVEVAWMSSWYEGYRKLQANNSI